MSQWLNKFKDFTKKEGAVTILAVIALVLIGIIVLVIALVSQKDGNKDNPTGYVPTESYVVDSLLLPESMPESGSTVDFNEILPENNYGEEELKVDIAIPENDFAASIFQLRSNYEGGGYIGQTIKISGINGTTEINGITYHDVYKKGLIGDTEEDGIERIGIEYVYDGQYPADGAWITVIGVLRIYQEGDMNYLTIDALSVEETEPGDEYAILP